MKTELSSGESAGRLERFYAESESEAETHLEYLLESQIRPVLAKSVNRRMASVSQFSFATEQDREDIVQGALVRVAQKLMAGRSGESQISSPTEYAARVAEYACDEFFRTKYRKRYNVMKRVLVNLRENPTFYAWAQGDSEKHGALSAWLPPPSMAPASRTGALRSDLSAVTNSIVDTYLPEAVSARPACAPCMQAALLWADGTLSVDDLVLVLQSARKEFDEPDKELDPEILASPASAPVVVEQEFLQAIWGEIRRLRPTAAKAILLNLRIKDDCGIETFWENGVATKPEVAALLGFELKQFEQEIVPELPWSDKRLATFLECTEDQVSSLRSAGRRTVAARIIAAKQFPEECFRFHL